MSEPMRCPYCDLSFGALLLNAAAIPDVAPLVCEGCAQVSLLIDGRPYRTTPEQLVAVTQSPAWRDVIAPAQAVIQRTLDAVTAVPTVDRTRVTLADGSPVTPDHREIDPRTGQQKAYVVLSAKERARGFVRPVRRTYRHVGSVGPRHALRELTMDEQARYAWSHYAKFEAYPESELPKIGRFWTQAEIDRAGRGCGKETTMGLALAETYARDPSFYSKTFCVYCRAHFPVDEFVWSGTDERVGS